MSKVQLGDEAKDSVTGFSGVVVAITQWIHGCHRVTLQPKVGKDGKYPDSASFDEPAVIVTKAKAVPKDNRSKKTGGVQNDKAALTRNSF